MGRDAFPLFEQRKHGQHDDAEEVLHDGDAHRDAAVGRAEFASREQDADEDGGGRKAGSQGKKHSGRAGNS